MTASFTRYCRSLKLLSAILALWLAAAVVTVHAQGIEVRSASFNAGDDYYVLEAQFDIALTHTLEEALNKGVSLYFLLEFELIRPRWYWFNERVIGFSQQHRLSYNALTRQYRLGIGNLHQSFSPLAEALEVMSRGGRRQDVEPGTIRRENYTAGIRMRLDTSQLPNPFQLNALGSREWYIGSDWFRWPVTPRDVQQ